MTNQKKKLNLPAIIITLIVAGWFYWFQWRPAEIRKECYQKTFSEVSREVKENKKGNKEWAEGKEWMVRPNTPWFPNSKQWGWWYPEQESFELVEDWYEYCLHKRGLK